MKMTLIISCLIVGFLACFFFFQSKNRGELYKQAQKDKNKLAYDLGILQDSAKHLFNNQERYIRVIDEQRKQTEVIQGKSNRSSGRTFI